MGQLLEPRQLAEIEAAHAGGLSARTIVEIFKPLGVRLSEATFRKYVQVGLLPRSRRVGRKGKHRGSQGLYPVGAVRRINVIKKMMAEGLTIEEILRSFVYLRNDIEEFERQLDALVGRHQEELGARPIEPDVKRRVRRELAGVRKDGKRLVQQFERIASQLVAGERSSRELGPSGEAPGRPRGVVG